MGENIFFVRFVGVCVATEPSLMLVNMVLGDRYRLLRDQRVVLVLPKRGSVFFGSMIRKDT